MSINPKEAIKRANQTKDAYNTHNRLVTGLAAATFTAGTVFGLLNAASETTNESIDRLSGAFLMASAGAATISGLRAVSIRERNYSAVISEEMKANSFVNDETRESSEKFRFGLETGVTGSLAMSQLSAMTAGHELSVMLNNQSVSDGMVSLSFLSVTLGSLAFNRLHADIVGVNADRATEVVRLEYEYNQS